MKKSKILSTLSLAVVMIISFFITACGGLAVKDVKIDESTVKSNFFVGEEIDYSKIQIKVTYEDDSFSIYKLTDEGVTYNQIDTSIAGEKILTVDYNGKTANLTVNVIELTLQGIEFASQEGLVVDYKTALDYDNIFIKVIYNDESVNETIAISDENVTILQGVDVNEIGTQTLTVEYMGKQASIEVEVKVLNAIRPLTFAIPQSYVDFKNESAVKDETLITENEFAIKGKSYIVGNVNKFKFVPSMSYLDVSAGIVTIENPITTYSLQLKGENGEYTTVDSTLYVDSVVDNMYQFNEFAEGKEFKLIVKPSEIFYDLSRWTNVVPTATIEFKVEKAYNVYDVYGLSVMDNLNVKNWAKIKDRTLIYDDKKLSEYTDVTLVVLHNDISVDADKLPSNYFWSEKTPGYDVALTNLKSADNASGGQLSLASKLVGSLRDGSGNGDMYNHSGSYHNSAKLNVYDEDGDGVLEDYAETWSCVNMQKGLFNTNQCSISGNYMTITTKDSETRRLSTVISFDYKTDNTLKMTNPISHWSMFKFYKTDSENLSINVENVFLQGNMPKVNESGLPAGLMGINTLIDELTVENVITSQFYTHIICDEKEDSQSKLNFKNSRMFDAYSNMIYLWRSDVIVENCIMKNAGGPLFILCDGERSVSDTTSPSAQLKVDDKSVLESYAAGTEAWYTIFNATMLFSNFKGMDTAMQAISGKTYVHNVNGAEQINLIAVIIPSPDTILSSRGNDELISVKGRFIKGDEVLDICDPIVEVVKTLGSVAFVSGGQYAFMPTATQVAPFYALAQMGNPSAATVPGDFANSSSNWLGVTMSAASMGVSNAPYFSVIIGNFEKI